MRAFEGIFVVAAFVFAFVASENVAESTGENDKSNETQTIIGCLGSQMKYAVDLSRNNTRTFLSNLSPKGNFNKTWELLNAEYDKLQLNINNTTKTVVEDRAKCEESNKTNIIRRSCDRLAKISYVQKNSKHLGVFMGTSMQIIIKAAVGFQIVNIQGKTLRFAVEQNLLLLKTLRNAVGCIKGN